MIVIESELATLFILQFTGLVYGSVVSPPLHIQLQRLAHVIPGVSVILVRSLPAGDEIVTLESIIVALLSVVGAFIVTFGGKDTL